MLKTVEELGECRGEVKFLSFCKLSNIKFFLNLFLCLVYFKNLITLNLYVTGLKKKKPSNPNEISSVLIFKPWPRTLNNSNPKK